VATRFPQLFLKLLAASTGKVHLNISGDKMYDSSPRKNER
jgi:hypothetical protein